MAVTAAVRKIPAWSGSRAAVGDGFVDFSSMARVARRPSLLVQVEVPEKAEAVTSLALPGRELHGSGELANGLWSEVVFGAWCEDV